MRKYGMNEHWPHVFTIYQIINILVNSPADITRKQEENTFEH
jgi:hypothetical protein